MEQVGNLPGVPLPKALLSSSAEGRVKQAAALGACRVTGVSSPQPGQTGE